MGDFRYDAVMTGLREMARKRKFPQVLVTRAPRPRREAFTPPDGPLIIDYVGLMRTPKMEAKELLSYVNLDVDKYAPDCAESLKRNNHMNSYAGAGVKETEVKAWLGGFAEHFATRYKGGQATGDVCMGMAKCAKAWRVKPGLSHSDQDTRDAVVVDFINFVAMRRGMDFAMYTVDLRKVEPGDEAYVT